MQVDIFWDLSGCLYFLGLDWSFPEQAAEGIDFDSQYGKVKKSDMLLKLQRTAPYYKRNRAHICSFFVKGECTRGAECPYRHEMPETGPLAEQNLKDRFYGVNDPVAEKMLSRANNMPVLSPPEDRHAPPFLPNTRIVISHELV
jgi:hypothetical protein